MGRMPARYEPTGVGKLMGHHLYLHASYALEAIDAIRKLRPEAGLRLSLAFKMKPSFKFQCVRLDLKDGLVRFDEAPDFDTAREPHVGRWLTACHDGYRLEGFSQNIWHHKFLWVKPSYQGFSVEESEAWSAKYSPLIAGVPKASVRTWEAQLEAAGLGSCSCMAKRTLDNSNQL